MFCKRCFCFSQKFSILLLCVFWSVGLLAGVYIADKSYFPVSFLMRTFTDGVSIVRLLLSIFSPFAITAFFAVVSAKFLLYLLAAFKAFTYSFCTSLIVTAFNGGGWLIKSLVLFSDSISMVLLIWILIRFFAGSLKRADVLIIVLILFAVCLLDFYFVIPFMASLF